MGMGPDRRRRGSAGGLSGECTAASAHLHGRHPAARQLFTPARRRTADVGDTRFEPKTHERGVLHLLIATSYPFLEVFWTMLIFFAFFIWIWLLFIVFADIFRRTDSSG